MKHFAHHHFCPVVHLSPSLHPPDHLKDRKNVISIHFTNFPDDWTHFSMWQVFRNYKQVIDIYTLVVRDRFGRKYGFAQFTDVHHIEDLLFTLNQIWIGDFQLVTSRANPKVQNPAQVALKSHKPLHPSYSRTHSDASYADIVRHNLSTITHPNPAQVVINVVKQDYRWLNGCYVVQVNRTTHIPNLQGYIRPMGGNMVLISSDDTSNLKDFVEDPQCWLHQIFIDIRSWSCVAISSERLIWV
ncbi:hypothetical protein Ancab_015440 [Ancistrocladus abbreviatus]